MFPGAGIPISCLVPQLLSGSLFREKQESARMDLVGARKVKDGISCGGITRPGLTQGVIGTHLILTLINLFR